MEKKADYLILQVRRAPWYVWSLRGAWVLWLIVWLEFAIGSRRELEPQAFATAVKVLIVSAFLGLALYFWRLRCSGRETKGKEDTSTA